MTTHDHLAASLSDDADWADAPEDAEIDDSESWDGLDDADEDVEHSALDDLFGPWLGDKEIVSSEGRRLAVPARGFYRD